LKHSPHSPVQRVTAAPRVFAADIAIDLEADNIQLRAALARSVDAGKRRDLVTDELRHRIGNLLTVVQAVARQTFSTADESSVMKFNARISALAAAQALLLDSEKAAARLSDVVANALAPHCSDGDRCTITGPVEITVDGRRAHALTLALHELATNAAKYGALSVDAGWVEVVWTLTDGTLDFLWREHEGPPVMSPNQRGFGARLITGNLSTAFAGAVDLAFNEAGLECRLCAPHDSYARQ
jgi:two-component sensor histidine kinase